LLLSIEVDLEYQCENPSNFLLQIEAANMDQQSVIDTALHVSPEQSVDRSRSDEGIGERIWLQARDRFKCQYRAKIKLSREPIDLETLKDSPLHEIRGEVTKYLMPSRYCHLDKFDNAIPKHLHGLSGGKLVVALSEWIKNEFDYVMGVSDVLTTAHDTLSIRQGVCRDYAQVMIAMLRVLGIPARMVSAYAPNVAPQDFHALVDVYLDGAWHLVDPTGMSTPDEVVIIGVGRDAADVSFLTAYGFLTMINQRVCVNVIKE
jgi:transglutaminase-like putative cysteine protease